MSHRFTVSLEENEFGETVVTIPDTLIEELGWRVGDELDYELLNDDTLTFKKTDE